MKHALEDDRLVLSLEGRVHSANAGQFESDILQCAQAHPGLPLVLDAEHLDYISSAGLRVLLRLIKRQDEPLVMRNVSPEVYDILDMSGFTQLMQIRRVPRRISIDGCPEIGHGAQGTIYRLDAETIVKVFNSPDSLPVIEREQQLSRFAFVSGIPTAIPYGIVRVGDTYGSEFELVDAGSFHVAYLENPDRREALLDEYVDLLKTVHAVTVARDALPDARQIFFTYLDQIAGILPGALAKGLRAKIEAMPEDLHVVHGDFHMKNILFSHSEPVLIDMETLCVGNPVFDLAALFIAYMAFSQHDPSNAVSFFGCDHQVLTELYDGFLRRYLGPGDPEALLNARQKIELLGYIQFLQKIVALNMGPANLRDFYIRDSVEQLQALLGRVDRLTL